VGHTPVHNPSQPIAQQLLRDVACAGDNHRKREELKDVVVREEHERTGRHEDGAEKVLVLVQDCDARQGETERGTQRETYIPA
jgi:hypothetical protein